VRCGGILVNVLPMRLAPSGLFHCTMGMGMGHGLYCQPVHR
jgi:hypothetical protein